MTFKVSGDAEVLGVLELGNSLTLEKGLGMGGQSCGFRLGVWVGTPRDTLPACTGVERALAYASPWHP